MEPAISHPPSGKSRLRQKMHARKRQALCLLCAAALALGSVPFIPAERSAQAADINSQATSIVVRKAANQGTTSVFNGNAYLNSFDKPVYGTDPANAVPNASGTEYTLIKPGTYATDYLVTHGYPGTTFINSISWAAADARSITQMAMWAVSGKSYSSYVSLSSSDTHEANMLASATALANAAKAYKGGEAKADGSSCILVVENNGSIQEIVSPTMYGHISLADLFADITADESNRLYDVSDIRYGIFTDPDCTESYKNYELTADEVENAKIKIAPGTYYLKEISDESDFFQPDNTVYRVKVGAYETAATEGTGASAQPKYTAADFVLNKTDKVSGATPQGNGTFALAEYTFEYVDAYVTSDQEFDEAKQSSNVARSWILRTDPEGTIDFTHALSTFEYQDKSYRYLVSGDELFTNDDGSAVLPFGTLRIRESLEPSGYLLSDKTRFVTIRPDGTGGVIFGGNVELVDDTVVVRDASEALSGGVALQLPASTAENAGEARFTVKNLSANPVFVGLPDSMAEYAPGEVISTLPIGNGTTVAFLTPNSGEDRTVSTALPYGRYAIQEIEGPNGYLLTNGTPLEFTISEPDQVVEYTDPETGGGEDLNPEGIHGGLCLELRDGESRLLSPLGAGSLSGVQFSVINASENTILVEGTAYQPGETVLTLTTDAGKATTSNTALPAGAYRVVQTATGTGYLACEAPEQTIRIRDDGQIATLTQTEELDRAFYASVMRSDLELDISDFPGLHRTGVVAFRLTSKTTGETHVLASNASGHASTASSFAAHSERTNANDQALNADGTVDLDKLDPAAGIWFGRIADQGMTEPQNALGALPYDEYYVEELSCGDQPSGDPVAFKLVVSKDREVINGKEAADEQLAHASLATLALDGADQDKELMPAENARIIDTVTYSNLKPGTEYTLTGILMDKDTAQPLLINGQQVTATSNFIPARTFGTAEVTFFFNAREAAGKTVVVYETLTSKGALNAIHHDLGSADQTVTCLTLQGESPAQNGVDQGTGDQNGTGTGTGNGGGLGNEDQNGSGGGSQNGTGSGNGTQTGNGTDNGAQAGNGGAGDQNGAGNGATPDNGPAGNGTADSNGPANTTGNGEGDNPDGSKNPADADNAAQGIGDQATDPAGDGTPADADNSLNGNVAVKQPTITVEPSDEDNGKSTNETTASGGTSGSKYGSGSYGTGSYSSGGAGSSGGSGITSATKLAQTGDDLESLIALFGALTLAGAALLVISIVRHRRQADEFESWETW